MTAPLRPATESGGQFRKLLRERLSNYERLSILVNLLDRAAPGLARRLSTGLYDPSRLPFPVERIKLFSYGSGSTVFLLEKGERRYILKVYRRSLGKNKKELKDLADHFAGKYQKVAGWYRGSYELTPASSFLILHGPLLARPAVAVLQEYIPGEKRDFFLDFGDEELLTLMEQADFRSQFLFFAQRTLEVYQESGLCFDFIGRDNLMVVQEGGRARLAIIDFGIFERNQMQAASPGVYRQVEARLARLKRLCGQLAGWEKQETAAGHAAHQEGF